jgi:hypothetical protein
MSAVLADILDIVRAARQKDDPVRGEKANQGMPDSPLTSSSLQERVAAVARVLDEAIARSDRRDTVPEHSARIANFFREAVTAGKPIAVASKDKRVAASHAHVLVRGIAIEQTHVGVVPKEAGKRVADVSGGAVLVQVLDAASAAPGPSGRGSELLVVDNVAPNCATEAHPEGTRRREAVHAG